MLKLSGYHFYGHEVSSYGKQYNRVDYRTLASSFDSVLNNYIMRNTDGIGYWEQVSGWIDNSEEIEELEDKIQELIENGAGADEYRELAEQLEEAREEEYEQPEIYQTYIVSDAGAEILKEAEEIVYYNDELDMYVWGVTHWGTSWDYVLTKIPCNQGYETENA